VLSITLLFCTQNAEKLLSGFAGTYGKEMT